MDIATLIGAYGYWALALFCFLEGETVLVLAGIAAQRGELALRSPAGAATSASSGSAAAPAAARSTGCRRWHARPSACSG